MSLNYGPLIYEGKAKRIFSTDNPKEVLVEFKNDLTAFNALKKSSLEDKGRLNCQISSYIFEMLEANGVSTHYLGMASDNCIFARRLEIIPLEVVVRNIAFGSLCKETTITPGTAISPCLIDFYFKDDELADPFLSLARLELLGVATSDQRLEIEQIARSVNKLMKAYFEKLDLLLVDFKIEIGVNGNGALFVADEISPDSCRIWDNRCSDAKERILDKDRFRQDLGDVIKSYREIRDRIQSVSSKPRFYK